MKDNSKHLNRIAVVGGGYIGVELAEAFERLGKDVVLVDIVDTRLKAATMTKTLLTSWRKLGRPQHPFGSWTNCSSS